MSASFSLCSGVREERSVARTEISLGYCEIVSVGCDKARGIELILENLGIPKERSIAIGDSLNDLGMIEYAEIGVAMGNAIDVIKENADLITDFVDNAGVAKALGKIFNIKL